MNDLEKIIPLLKTIRPTDIFKKVVVFNESVSEVGNRAMVRIGLSSGFVLEGTPLKVDAEGNAIFMAAGQSISYVDTNRMSSVEILNPYLLLEVLTEGAYFEVPENDIQSKLNLKRTFKSLNESVADKYQLMVASTILEDDSLSEAEKYQFGQFLAMLQNTLEGIGEDDQGKKALTQVDEIQINSDTENLLVQKGENLLQVGINFKNKFAIDFQEKLKLALESNL